MSFYDQAAAAGGSGYFSAPSDGLDPSLFDGMQLKGDVRHCLVVTLMAGLQKYLSVRGAHEWLSAWLAGSGITYQWHADRGNGDLDVLFGVDMPGFVHYNPEYQGIPERDIANYSDTILKEKLWPKTARTRFGQQEYEVTFFWAPGVGSRIEHIHPYSAYDLLSDAWVVTPPALPDDPRALYPREWYDAAERDSKAASYLQTRHGSLANTLSSTDSGSAKWVNATAEIARVRQSARALFDEIHGGRQEAFGEQGHGYGDPHNFRWQASKQSGAIASLKAIIDADPAAGTRPDGPGTILTRDMLSRGNHPYLR